MADSETELIQKLNRQKMAWQGRAQKLIPAKLRSWLEKRATMWHPVQDDHVQYVARMLDAIQYSV